jgi:prophage tail gpP-like protein
MVDEITASADISRHSVTVIGRSPARDIVDSAWGGDNDGFPLNNTLYQITKHICDKFKITCGIIPKDQGDITEPVTVFSWENESPWSKLIAEADSQSFILSMRHIRHTAKNGEGSRPSRNVKRWSVAPGNF